VLIRACRPRQWVKNSLVALAPAAAGSLRHADRVAAVLGTFIAFCLLSSATYLLNDIRDRDEDRRHPRKRLRPVASGELSSRGALRIALVLGALGLLVGTAVTPLVGLIGFCYLALTTTYSIWWRRVALLDIAAVAGGFVLRAAAGGAAGQVPLSRAFLIVTTGCALFLVAGKRYAERGESVTRGRARDTLSRYSRRSLIYMLTAAATLSCCAYVWWAFGGADPGLLPELSTLPFMMWLGRYAIMLGRGAGEAPEELALRDPGLLALTLLWALLFVSGIYGPR
jgi:decaprenyl-phosphate phosphoribosyltransferase